MVKPNKKSALIVQDRADFCLLLTKIRWSGILKVESTNTQKSGIIKKTRKEKEEMTTYSKEFKAEALRLSDEIGVQKAAKQLGIPYCSSVNISHKLK